MPRAKPSLRWSSAAKIAWRELQASKVKFLFVIFSVAIGVAALTGVRGFSDSFEKTLLGEARTIMAADLSARMFRQPTGQEEQQLNALAAAGVDRTEVTEMMSMASSPADPVPLLIALKVVDPRKYPFYGSVELDPAGDLGKLLTDSTVIVAEDLLIRLHTRVGASLKIGDASFRISAVLLREPDRMSSGMGLGPRVLMSEGALAKSGLLQQGSRAGERILFKLPAGAALNAPVTQLGAILPDAQITDFRETNPVLTDGPESLDRAAEPDLPGGHGAGRDRRCHGHARASAAENRSAGRHEVDWRAFLRHPPHLSLADGAVGDRRGADRRLPGACRRVDLPFAPGVSLADACASFTSPSAPRLPDWEPAS